MSNPTDAPRATEKPNPIPGYRDLSQEELAAVGATKRMEAANNGFMDMLATLPDVDRRQLALANTKLEEAFMHAIRAITKPTRLVIEMPKS